jgi:hypothetical protein
MVKRITFAGLLRAFCADAAHARRIDDFTVGKPFQGVSMRGTDVAGGPNGTGSYAFRFDDRDSPENSSIRLLTADEAIEIIEPRFFAIGDALTRAPKIAEFR